MKTFTYLFILLVINISSVKSQVKLDSLLSAYYPFTIDAGDSSGNNNHGILQGLANANGELHIGDNGLDYVSLPFTLLDGATNFTISTDVRFQTPHTGGTNPINVFLSAANPTSFNEFFMGYYFRQENWGFFLNNVNQSFPGDAPLINQWYHLVCTREGDRITWFQNGLPIFQEKVNNLPLNIAPNGLILGQDQDAVGGNFQANQSLAGDLDNFRIYRRSLSGEEIDSLNSFDRLEDIALEFVDLSDFGVINPGNFDIKVNLFNKSASTLYQATIQWEINGVLQPSISWNTGALTYLDSTTITLGNVPINQGQSYDIKAWTEFPNGKDDIIPENDTATAFNLWVGNTALNHSLYLDGVDDYANLNWLARDLSNKNPFTIEFWMKGSVNENPNFVSLLGINNQNINNELLIAMGSSSGNQNGKIMIIDSTGVIYNGNAFIGDNGWHHIAYVQSGNNGTLYIDGIIDGTVTTNLSLDPRNDWSLGQEYDDVNHGNFFKGYLDEFRVWSVARSQVDIQNWMLQNTGLYGEPGLESAYHFDSLAPAIIYDRKSCNHGFLLNGASVSSVSGPIGDITNDPFKNCGCSQNNDLDTWDQKGQLAFGNWIIDSEGDTARQTFNATRGDQYPTFLVSPHEMINVRIKFSTSVSMITDDDFIGFVFGYKTSETNPNYYDFWLFDWKKETQLNSGFNGLEGKTLSRVAGDMTGINTLETFWGHNSGSNGLRVLKTDTGAGKGWENDSIYNFVLTYTTSKAIIEINGDTIFVEENCFQQGKFGFYSFSQQNVSFFDFSYEPISSFQVDDSPSCLGDTVALSLTPDSCNVLNGFEPLSSWIWDFGDGFTSQDSTPNHIYSNQGKYTISLHTQDWLGCKDTSSVLQSVGAILNLELGADTIICPNEGLDLMGPSGYSSYLWNTGEMTSNISIVDSGWYTLQVIDSLGCTDTDSIFVGLHNASDMVCWATGIDEVQDESFLIQIGPNPFDNDIRLSIGLPKHSTVIVSLIPMLGNQSVNIYEGMLPEGIHDINISDLNFSKGIYLIQVNIGGENVASLKMVKS